MRPVSNQSARFFATTKTHKFNVHSLLIEMISNIDQLYQSNTYTFNSAKIVSDYLQPLVQNNYVIKDTHTFAEIIKNGVLDPDEEYVSYDTDSLFTRTPVNETIDYIITEIYENK